MSVPPPGNSGLYSTKLMSLGHSHFPLPATALRMSMSPTFSHGDTRRGLLGKSPSLCNWRCLEEISLFFLSDHDAGNYVSSCDLNSQQRGTLQAENGWEERRKELCNHYANLFLSHLTWLPSLDEVVDFTCCLGPLICSLHLEAS